MASIRSRVLYRIYKLRTSPFDPKYSIEQQRLNLEKLAKRASVPREVAVERVTVGERPGEWLRPAVATPDRVVLYLHGGGYCAGSCGTHRALAARVAVTSKAPVLLLDYRLAPESPFPAALDDAVAAAGWLGDQGIEPGKVAFIGDSAGGGLAVATALSLRDAGRPLPAALVCLSPWTDLTGSGESVKTCARLDPLLKADSGKVIVPAYLGDTDPRSPLVSPIFADLTGLPPLLIQVGDHEILLSDSLRLADVAREAGVEVSVDVWKGMWHVWQAMAGLIPEAQRAIDEVGAFLDERLSPDEAGVGQRGGA